MYRRKGNQIDLFENPLLFGGVRLDPENKWVRAAKLIPWPEFEGKYAAAFKNEKVGQKAYSARVAAGSLIIRERYGFSDRDTVEEIAENPYLQYFLGMTQFSSKPPFDASQLTYFRKRITPEMLAELNDYIIGRKGPGDDGPSDQPPEESASQETKQEEHKGTLILDATCCPQNIRFPTDVSLLNEARELLEGMIDTAHESKATQGSKPRTYRKKARRDYLRYARNRKPSKNALRAALRKQLGYIARDLGYLDKILALHTDVLTTKQAEQLDVIRTLYAQQEEMFREGKRSIPQRIVSIHQPWVRPIVRGKTKAPVEFGAKVEFSMTDGYMRIESLQWEPFHEGTTLIASVEKYRRDMGHYPERILADKIFRNRANLDYCKEKGIRLNGPKLGRPPKDKTLYREQLRLEREEAGERNEIEGGIGVCKTRYTLDCIWEKLQHTSEVTIHVGVLTRNLFKRLKAFLRLFFDVPRSAVLVTVFSFSRTLSLFFDQLPLPWLARSSFSRH